MDVDALHDQQEALLTALTTADGGSGSDGDAAGGPAGTGWDATVAPCAPWTVTDLVLHLASVHRWAADAVVAAPDAPLPPRTDPSGPRAPEAVLAEYTAAAALLRERLSARAPDAPCLGLVGPADAAFWARRQTAETAVHRWDVEAALAAAGAALATGPSGGDRSGSTARSDRSDSAGRSARRRAVDPDSTAACADVVAEVVEVMHPRQVLLGRAPALGHGIGLVAVDADRRWTLGGEEEVVVVGGPAGVLARLLWRRTTAAHPDLVVTGDADALTRALAGPLTP